MPGGDARPASGRLAGPADGTRDRFRLAAPATVVALGLALLDAGLYAVLGYHLHHGRLPLGEAAVFVKDVSSGPAVVTFPLIILLFSAADAGARPRQRVAQPARARLT